jgi:hypothetical protein
MYTVILTTICALTVRSSEWLEAKDEYLICFENGLKNMNKFYLRLENSFDTEYFLSEHLEKCLRKHMSYPAS